MGGQAERPDVLDRVENELRSQLSNFDYGPRSSRDTTPIWQHSTDAARQDLVEDGLLRDDSEWGVWELTPDGWTRDYTITVYLRD